MNPGQFRRLIRETLEALPLPYSEAAENLLFMTAAHETKLGEYLWQVGGGPALGFWQMEPATLDDLYVNYLSYHEGHLRAVDRWMPRGLTRSQSLVYSLGYQVATARYQYWRRPEPLPLHVTGLAGYAKKHWNSESGKATWQDYENAYWAFSPSA